MWQKIDREGIDMYFEIDLDHNALLTIGYVLCVALIVKAFIVATTNKKK